MPQKKNKSRKTIMVSSSVYGQEELLRRIFDLLTQFGYDVWMSYMGTIPTHANENSLDSCLRAVDNCDLFLGIVTPYYGTTKGTDGEISATHEEMRKAIKLKKPRWFLVDDRVIFARQLLNKISLKTSPKQKLRRSELQLDLKGQFDIQSIDLYEEVTEKHVDNARLTKVKWVQPYIAPEDATRFVSAQFRRYQDVEQLIKDWFKMGVRHDK